MPFQIFTIPFNPAKQTFITDELNAFCLNKRVLSKNVSFFQDQALFYWTILVEYDVIQNTTKEEKVELDDIETQCFNKLKAWRNEQSEKEGVPAYVLARNSQLIEMVKQAMTTKEVLKQIKGFGDKKIANYGDDIIQILKAFFEA